MCVVKEEFFSFRWSESRRISLSRNGRFRPRWWRFRIKLLFLEFFCVIFRKISELASNQGARVAQWWEHSCLTNVHVARLQIPASTLYVGVVCCWFSALLREVFLWLLIYLVLATWNGRRCWYIGWGGVKSKDIAPSFLARKPKANILRFDRFIR